VRVRFRRVRVLTEEVEEGKERTAEEEREVTLMRDELSNVKEEEG
jgi:hypothetical protein